MRALTFFLFSVSILSFAENANKLIEITRLHTGHNVLRFDIEGKEVRVIDHNGIATAAVVTYILTQPLASKDEFKNWEKNKQKEVAGYPAVQPLLLSSMKKLRAQYEKSGQEDKKLNRVIKILRRRSITFEELAKLGEFIEKTQGKLYAQQIDGKVDKKWLFQRSDKNPLGLILTSRRISLPVDGFSRSGVRTIKANLPELVRIHSERSFKPQKSDPNRH